MTCKLCHLPITLSRFGHYEHPDGCYDGDDPYYHKAGPDTTTEDIAGLVVMLLQRPQIIKAEIERRKSCSTSELD